MFNSLYTPSQLTRAYGYGCYCLNLGDRPLSGTMTGKAISFLSNWETSLRRVSDGRQGSALLRFRPLQPMRHLWLRTWMHSRTSRLRGKNWNFQSHAHNKTQFVQNGTSITCTNEPNTCEQAICECDKDSVLGFANVIDIYEPTFHAFNGFDPVLVRFYSFFSVFIFFRAATTESRHLASQSRNSTAVESKSNQK